MAWRIEFADSAEKELDDLEPQTAKRILKFLSDRIVSSNDPRDLGAALRGKRFKGLWKYRVGDHRIIARIEDRMLVVTVVRIGNRRDVYR